MLTYNFNKGWCSPSYGTSVNVVLPDLDLPNGITVGVALGDFELHFQGQTFETLIFQKQSQRKMQNMTFIDVEICHRMASLRMLYSMTVTKIFIYLFLNINILEIIRASV